MHEKIALIQPRIVAGTSLGIDTERPPTSIQTLAAQLEREGHDVRMFHEHAGDILTNRIAEFSPRIVGISTMTANFLEGKKIADAVKTIRKEILVLLGGWHAAGCAQAHLQGQESESIAEILNPESPFYYMVVGEGELVLPELVRRLSNGANVNDLNGVCYLDEQEIRVTIADRIKNLDVLADPSWRDLVVESYRDQHTGILDLHCHFKRACRFNCGFCSTSTVYGHGVKAFSPARAVDQMERLLMEFEPEMITIDDEDFFAHPKWVEAIVQLLEERNLHSRYGVEFDTFATVNDLYGLDRDGKGDFLDRMRRAGFTIFTIGIESMNPKVLRSYNKEWMILLTMHPAQRHHYRNSSHEEQDEILVNHYFDRIQRAINFAKQHGILIIGDYIVGNLGESEEDVRKGFEKFSNLRNLHIAYLPIFTPFPGTALWKESYYSGRIVRDRLGNINWSRFDASAGALDLDYDIAGLRDELELQFYTSERYRADMLTAIKDNPKMVTMFKARFNYLNRLFPDDELVRKRLWELDQK